MKLFVPLDGKCAEEFQKGDKALHLGHQFRQVTLNLYELECCHQIHFLGYQVDEGTEWTLNFCVELGFVQWRGPEVARRRLRTYLEGDELAVFQYELSL